MSYIAEVKLEDYCKDCKEISLTTEIEENNFYYDGGEFKEVSITHRCYYKEFCEYQRARWENERATGEN